MISCQICQAEFEDKSRFAAHLQFQHKMKSEEYTILYVYGGVRPTCPACGAETRYMGGQYAFQLYCKAHANEARANWSKDYGFGANVSQFQNLGKTKENCEYMAERSERMKGNPGCFQSPESPATPEKKLIARKKGVATARANRAPHIPEERYNEYVAMAREWKIEVLSPLETVTDSMFTFSCRCMLCGKTFMRKSAAFRPDPTLKSQTFGCTECTRQQITDMNRSKHRMTEEEFNVNRAKAIAEQQYEILTPYSEYINNKQYLRTVCHVCGTEGKKRMDAIIQGGGCYTCKFKGISSQDREIEHILLERGYEVETHKSISLEGRKRIELDIFLPQHNVAIEHNGLYWHCEKEKDRLYHLRKYQICKERGIHLIQIFEDEWRDKRDIVLSMIDAKCGRISTKITARQCEVRPIDKRTAAEFATLYHIAGASNVSFNSWGLFHDGTLVAAIIFRKPFVSKYGNAVENCSLCCKT